MENRTKPRLTEGMRASTIKRQFHAFLFNRKKKRKYETFAGSTGCDRNRLSYHEIPTPFLDQFLREYVGGTHRQNAVLKLLTPEPYALTVVSGPHFSRCLLETKQYFAATAAGQPCRR
jgi:hypothetical protein